MEQISTEMELPFVDFVVTVSPHAHLITHSSYLGWMFCFIFFHLTKFFSLVFDSDFISRYIISQRIAFVNTFFRFFRNYLLNFAKSKTRLNLHHYIYEYILSHTCDYFINFKCKIKIIFLQSIRPFAHNVCCIMQI